MAQRRLSFVRNRHHERILGDGWFQPISESNALFLQLLCLKYYRPDLDIFTIATPPTGLTLVTGRDPTSKVLSDHFADAVARFIDVLFSGIENRLDGAFNIASNDWGTAEARREWQVL